MMKLDTALAGVTGLGFDTSLFIYFVERHPPYVQMELHVLVLDELEL